jgi:YjbE family integral membrane protein
MGAVIVRVVLTVTVLWVLNLPGLMLAGGVLLAWIAYRLLTGDDAAAKRKMTSAASFWSAIRTIVVADAVMGLDNVLGVAGAARGSILLIVLGLATSIPIVVWGSTLILKWLERFPGLLYFGGAVLAWTAATMINEESFVAERLAEHPVASVAMYALVVGAVLGLAWLRNRRPVLQSQWR